MRLVEMALQVRPRGRAGAAAGIDEAHFPDVGTGKTSNLAISSGVHC
jgi:hypothetical protein